MNLKFYLFIVFISSIMGSCDHEKRKEIKQITQLTAKEILGNPNYLAISYGGYRENSREIQPTIDEIKEDMKILRALGIRIVRTYNVHLPQASNLLQAIKELKHEDPTFEMYVMLGAWIDCKNAWTNEPDHTQESERNQEEISIAVALAKQYPDIVKIIAVGNESMVKWAASYYVQPSVILKWVRHLQDLKKKKVLPKDLWVTSSDNFASWGGGNKEYHIEDLEKLIQAVDYISIHTYPMHDTYYNPSFWYTEGANSSIETVNNIMLRAKKYAISQYDSVVKYINQLGIDKPVHIGETGWASYSNELYGNKGTKATDQYKQALYYKHLREWTSLQGISCFFFEAFDEHWKDAKNTGGSENHFGLFTVEGKAKYALWDVVDSGAFRGLHRGKNPIMKTYNGNKDSLLLDVQIPLPKKITTRN